MTARENRHKYCQEHKATTKKYYQDHKEIMKKYYQENKETIVAQRKQYYQENKETIKNYREANKERISGRGKIYREANKERISNAKKRYRETHKEHIKQYLSCHLERDRIRVQKREARKRSLPSTLTVSQWEKTKLYFDNRCAYCGDVKPLAQDHFVALSKNGAYSQDNIVPCCQSCNSSKSNKQFETWYENYKYCSKGRKDKILEFLSLSFE